MLAGACCAADDPYTAIRAKQEASVQRQLASARKQEAAAAPRSANFYASPISCERGGPAEIREMVDEGAKETGLDTDLVRAVVNKESAYNPCATSIKGAQGLMQLMPAVQTQF